MWNATINHCFCLRTGARGDVLLLGDDMAMRYDNPFSTRRKNLRREYEHVCRLGRMDAKVSVHHHLSEVSFLSKHFVLTERCNHVMVPFLGKAMARFNVRASSNEAVSDEAYLAGKALSYAYEFRYCKALARVFLLRFVQLGGEEGLSLDGLGWNAKGAFLRLGTAGILAAVDNPVGGHAQPSDFTRFWHWKYGKTHSEVIEMAMAFVFGEHDLDEDGVGWICSDFS